MNTARKYNWHKVVAMLLCVVATCSFFSCSSADDSSDIPPTPIDDKYAADSRTVLVYIVGENDLSRCIKDDVEEMLAGIKSNKLKAGDNLVLYIDDYEKPRIYLLNNRTKAVRYSELVPVKKYSTEVNSASADNLADVLQYVKTNYKADSYGLVMWSHGSGWLFSGNSKDNAGRKSPRRTIGLDGYREMNIDAMADALRECMKLDFVLFDACFMQSIETAYELKDCADCIIGSPAEIPDSGAYYTTMTEAMFKADDCAKEIVDKYHQHYAAPGNLYGIIVSAIKTEKLDDFVAETKSYVEKYRTELLSADYSEVQNYFKFGAWSTDYPDFPDMKGVMRKVLTDAEYASYTTTMSETVYCRHAAYWYTGYARRRIALVPEQSGGVSMFIPQSKYNYSVKKYNEMFERTSWYKDVWK